MCAVVGYHKNKMFYEIFVWNTNRLKKNFMAKEEEKKSGLEDLILKYSPEKEYVCSFKQISS